MFSWVSVRWQTDLVYLRAFPSMDTRICSSHNLRDQDLASLKDFTHLLCNGNFSLVLNLKSLSSTPRPLCYAERFRGESTQAVRRWQLRLQETLGVIGRVQGRCGA